MSSPSSPPILYRYDGSPYCQKTESVLLLKKIPYRTVNVSRMLPRPEITDILGLKYRKIPILAIGNDVYCDTSLIIPTLERRYPNSRSIFPPRKNDGSSDTGLIKAFVKHFSDEVVFPSIVALIPFGNLDLKFVEDRMKLIGGAFPKDPHSRAKAKSSLYSQIVRGLVEEQLSDGREWLFDTETPGLGDIGVHYVYSWANTSPFLTGAKELFDEQKFPKTLAWLTRISEYLDKDNKAHLVDQLDGDVAGKEIASSTFEPYDVVGFDEKLASWLGLEREQTVSVAPTGRYNAQDYSTVGKLVALNNTELTVEIDGSSGKIRVHFPVEGFQALPEPL